jgi:hypothetical protein
MAGDDRLGYGSDGHVGVSGAVAKTRERVVGADRVALHQDPLGLLDQSTAPDRSVDATEFGVAAQDDIQCVRQLGMAAVLDEAKMPRLAALSMNSWS